MTGVDLENLEIARKQARAEVQVHRAHIMLYAAGLAALTIVAVAATIMTVVF